MEDAVFWGAHESPFGVALLLATERGLLGLAFADSPREAQISALQDMRARWPRAAYIHAPEKTAPYLARIFKPRGADARALRLILIGTDFQIRVWKALLSIPFGETTHYAALGEMIGAPKGASRAIGGAVGRNPLSYIIPCHRALRRDGSMGGYHWGLARKRVMLAYEKARSSL